MTFAHTELLAAAILDVVRISHKGMFVGPSQILIDRVAQRWSGEWTNDDAEEALGLLREFRGLSRSAQLPTAHYISINYDGALKLFYQSGTHTFIPSKKFPLIAEYFQFGGQWLRALWDATVQVREREGEADAGRIIPASDRIVSLKDNQPQVLAIDESLGNLERELEKNNEAFEVEPEARSVAIAEVSALRRLLAASSIRIDSFRDRAAAVLKWVSEKSAAAAVAELCKHAIKLILGWS